MDEKMQSIFSLAAVFLLLLTAMIDPLISFAVAAAMLIFFLYEMVRNSKKGKKAKRSRKHGKRSARRKRK